MKTVSDDMPEPGKEARRSLFDIWKQQAPSPQVLSKDLLTELAHIRVALQRIADALELGGQSRGSTFRSYYTAPPTEEHGAGVLLQSDEDFAAIETLEQAKMKAKGDVGMDEEIEDNA